MKSEPLPRPPVFDALRDDLKLALRLPVQEPGYAATVLATLAVAIGATVAVASVFHSVVLRPLPFPEPERLVALENLYPGAGVTEHGGNSVPHYFDRRKSVEAFEEVAVFRPVDRTLDGEGAPERIAAALASPSLFPVLRVEPALGRFFAEEESEPGNEAKAVLSWGLWRRFYGGSDHRAPRGGARALGQTLRVDGTAHTVVGVLPPGFRFVDLEAELWLPAAFTAEDRSDDRRHSNNWVMVARLAPGATVERARGEVEALNATERERFPEMGQLLLDAGFHTEVEPLREALIEDIRPTLGLLVAGSLCVLLIACVNLANLALARATARTRELATRSALGAGRRATAARDLLVGVQVAGAAILLVGAGLLLASFVELLAVDPGFRAEGVATATVSLPDSRYAEDAARLTFARELVAAARDLPGVESAAAATAIPFGGSFSANAISVEGYVRRPGESLLAPFQTLVTPGYFETLGIPLLDGRTFDERDRQGSLPVVVVDRWLAERYWPGESALGKRIALGAPDLDEELRWMTVVGVAGEVRMATLGAGEQHGAFYMPHGQQPGFSHALTLVARVGPEGVDPAALTKPVRRVVQRIDPALPIFDAATLEERVGRSLIARRAGAFLLTRSMAGLLYGVEATDPAVYAVVALMLAAVALAASLVPARRATRVDPAVVLTSE
jgi:hypothetical protein